MAKSTPVKNMIFTLRGQRVMLDSDLAKLTSGKQLYEVETRRINEAVKRNLSRFPADFMFQLTEKEWAILRSQIAIFNNDTRKYRPYAFTEHGILMLSSVLRSDVAVDVNIKIMRVFVKMRQYALSPPDTNGQIAELRKLLLLYVEKNDKRVNDIIKVLDRLIAAPPPPSKTIGFKAN
jgi:hypothetical protein